MPALHQLGREGHNWSNARERWHAFQTLVQWACAGSNVTKRAVDAPVQIGEAAAGSKATVERDAAGRAVAVHGCLRRAPDVHCRLFTDFTMGHLRDLGVRLNQAAAVSINGVKCPFSVVLSSGYPYTQHPDPNTVVANEDPEGAALVPAILTPPCRLDDRVRSGDAAERESDPPQQARPLPPRGRSDHYARAAPTRARSGEASRDASARGPVTHC